MLEEDDDTKQKGMPNENIDNIKLAPILKEAYELLVQIENLRTEADKRIKELEKEKTKLREKRENLAAMTTVED